MIRDFFSFQGRLSKKDYLRKWLIVYVLMIAANYLWNNAILSIPVVMPFLVVLTVAQLSLSVRRCHDIGLSKGKTLAVVVLSLIPLVTLLTFIYLAWAASEPYDNEFGPVT